MPTDPRIDAYIAVAAPFARPILEHIRGVVHRALPEAEETLKWSMPHWTVGGKNVAGMAAFKAHCAMMIHGDGRQGDAMGQYGRITALSELPPDDELVAKLQEARERVKTKGSAAKKAAARTPKPEIAMPEDFAAALAAAPGTRERFEAMPPSARREYLEWIVGAKRAETRAARIAKACAQIAESKKLNWKYEKC